MLPELGDLLAQDMRSVDRLIRERLRSDVVLINQLGTYIVAGGGKRLRPQLVLLAAGAARYQGAAHIAVAAVIEFIHTATLLHDDVVDASRLRRGRETANTVWGNEAAVLVGDFLYSRAFQMMVEVGDMRVMDILSDTTNLIAEGEVMQLLNVHDPGTSERRYLDVITGKTAKLFEAATRLGGVLAAAPPGVEDALARFGLHLGLAFQLIDDLLDYSAESSELGKNVGDDLAEGKPTLPLILAIQRAGDADAALLRKAVEQGGLDDLERVIAIVRDTGALGATRERAEAEARIASEALEALEGGPHREALLRLAEFAVTRDH